MKTKINNFVIYWTYFLKFYFQIQYSRIRYKKTKNLKRQYDCMLFGLMTHHNVNQRYAKKYPYFYHLNMVLKVVLQFSYLIRYDINASFIAILHDVIEDCRLTYNDVVELYGKEVADGVYACTELRGRTRAERHGPEYISILQENRIGRFVKICDIIANMTYGKKTKSSMYEKYKAEYPKLKNNLYTEEFKDMFLYIEKNLLK